MINMNDYRAKPDSMQSPPAILYECRELMTGLLSESLPIMMNEVDDVLHDIAVRTTNSQERTKYFNATHEVRLMSHDIEQKCIENYIQLFNENLGSDIYEMKDIGGAKDMSIVAMENATNKVRNNCRQALLNLDRQMSNILKNCDMQAKKNPLTPEIVCRAFYNACELIDSGMEIRLIIFKKFEKSVLPLLNDVYLEINHILEGDSSSLESQQTSTAVDRGEGFQNIADVKKTVTSEIENLLTDQHAPDFVSDFLLDQWAKLLVRIYNKSGMEGDSWRHARETAEDLIWSVGSLSSKQDRDRLDKLWPDLVLRLRNGMKMILMPPHQVNNFISSLLKHRASLTMLAALTQSKKNDVPLIKPEKIKGTKNKIKSDSGQVMAKEKDLDSTGSEDKTMPVLKKHSGKRPSLSDSLSKYHSKKTDFDSVIDEDIKISGPKKDIDSRPFMDELFVENFNVKGFKTDITGG